MNIKRFLRRRREKRRISNIRAANDYRMEIFYGKDPRSEFSRLCDLHGSDKGTLAGSPGVYSWPAHSYADFYEMLFGHCRHEIGQVLECGIGTNNPDLPSSMGAAGRPGASLRVWRDYFPNAHVTGVDIDPDTLFREDRISTYRVDQTSPDDIAAFLSEAGAVGFDLIVDDGLHTFDAAICFFENTVRTLARTGIYVIEDVPSAELARYTDYFRQRHDDYAPLYAVLHRPKQEIADNCMVAVRRRSR